MGFGLGSIAKAVGIAGDLVGIGQSLMPADTNPNWTQLTNPKAIQIRVKDAQAAGVHPLFALGAQVSAASPVGTTTGSGVGDAIGNLGGRLSRMAAMPAQKAAVALQATESASRVRVNETQAMLNEARSRSVIAEMQTNPAVTSQALDMSFVKDQTGRLSMFRDASGKWRRVDRSVAPSSVLEEEYGETSELQGLWRAMKGASDWGGVADWPSLSELREIVTEKLYHNY